MAARFIRMMQAVRVIQPSRAGLRLGASLDSTRLALSGSCTTGAMNLRVYLIFILSMASTRLEAAPALIQAGPMVGHVGDSEARVWLRIKAGSVISATLQQAGNTFLPSRIESLESGFHLVRFATLLPGKACEVDLNVSRDGDRESVKTTFRTAPKPSTVGRVEVAFGSCSKVSQYKTAPIFKAVAAQQPDMMIFAGDNSYFIVGDGSDKHFNTSGPVGDWLFPEGMVNRHLITRVNPDLQDMLRSVPCYGIWDDHDYGPNNADRTFALREEATKAFIQMWANPAYGTAETPGTFSAFRHGPLEVFLLDDRYYKYSPQEHDDVTPETGSIWGAEQLAWLLQGLKDSTAPVKLIANGTQVISQSEGGEGHYREARGELDTLLAYLSEHKIGGVVFLTGDRHFSEAMQQALPSGPLVVECTSSPLQQDQKVGPLVGREHPNRLWAMRGNNFGLVTVDLPEEGKVSCALRRVTKPITFALLRDVRAGRRGH